MGRTDHDQRPVHRDDGTQHAGRCGQAGREVLHQVRSAPALGRLPGGRPGRAGQPDDREGPLHRQAGRRQDRGDGPRHAVLLPEPTRHRGPHGRAVQGPHAGRPARARNLVLTAQVLGDQPPARHQAHAVRDPRGEGPRIGGEDLRRRHAGRADRRGRRRRRAVQVRDRPPRRLPAPARRTARASLAAGQARRAVGQHDLLDHLPGQRPGLGSEVVERQGHQDLPPAPRPARRRPAGHLQRAVLVHHGRTGGRSVR